MKLRQLKPNQAELHVNEWIVFFSYNTAVAACTRKPEGTFKYYRTASHYSTTTSKHINAWLNGNQTEEKPQAFFDGLVEGKQPIVETKLF